MRGKDLKLLAASLFAIFVLLFLWAVGNALWSRKVGGAAIAAERPPRRILGGSATVSEDLTIRPPKIVLGSFSVDIRGLSAGRRAAIAYARRYWNRTCSCGFSYQDSGGDCAHFVSHCLLAGGIDNHGRGRGWKGNRKIIVGCPRLYRWLVPQHGTVVGTISKLEPGDVIFYGNFEHVALYLGSGKVASHSENCWGRDYLKDSRRKILVRIKYP